MLNIVLLVGLLYLSWTVVWLVRSLWSCIKAFALSDLVRVKLQSSSYGWAGKTACMHALLSVVAVVSDNALLCSGHWCFRWNRKRVCNTGKVTIGKEYAIQVR